jgi:hypothetical protein
MPPNSGRQGRLALLGLLGLAAVIAVALQAPIPQPATYHGFADQRRLLGIPHFWNVVSNLPFLLIGLAGVHAVAVRRTPGGLDALRSAYLWMFLGVAAVAAGSAYYHLAPSNASLTWDRLPMTIAFMAFFVIVVGEHIDPRWALRLLPPLLLVGAGAVLYWHSTESAGHGDLRPYLMVQFVPLAVIPLVLLLFPSRVSGVGYLWGVLAAYVLAKLFELADRPLFSLGEWVSGHTLKHVAAAAGAYVFLLALKRRPPMVGGELVNTVPAGTPATNR